MTPILQKILIIKVKNYKVKITNGMPRMISFFYITPRPKLINLKNVTFVKIIKMKLCKKLLLKITSTPMEKSLRKKQSIKQSGAGLKEKDQLEWKKDTSLTLRVKNISVKKIHSLVVLIQIKFLLSLIIKPSLKKFALKF